ncbi:agmatine deiminase family protein [Pelagicoccus sp. NFK12]|uniref:Agmatine deiminase family protein n=1 Tax=Pelagicoccus enzymogenes TaxID=2773457 RepID=A0A927FCG2_9BACT|nr:agmatine deiminase family protein [Pelagicoccus enzymogenes]MBD5782573.1 agmatine deiminase family protein [Pelagicoccus enzymogenes]MDQ8199514.1 agmatine deiminase family protein [Pelagicoccus enzymogenes]
MKTTLFFAAIFACVVSVSAQRELDSLPKERPAKRDAFSRSLPLPIRIPGEFGKLSAVLLSANEMVHFHPELFATLVGHISERAPVVAIVAGPEQILNGREALEEAGVDRDRVHFLVHQLDSMWIRDFGPIFIRRSDGSGAIVDTYYSARDELGSRPLDDQFPLVLANALGVQCSYVPIAMEGGNLVHNGNGLGVSSMKLIERNRFRNFSGDEFTGLMNTYFSLKTLTFVPSIPGEQTGHADMFMTFLNPKTVVIAKALEEETEQVRSHIERAAQLVSEQLVDGQPVQVHRIPLPPRKEGSWRSYTNVFYVNGLMLVPSYSDVDPKMEEEVFATYRKLLPKWDVVPIPADDLIETGGFLHCLTLGIPHFIDPNGLLEFTE